MKKIASGTYLYKNFKIRNHGYYPPDKCVLWEAVDVTTGCADFWATTKRDLKDLIDADKEN